MQGTRVAGLRSDLVDAAWPGQLPRTSGAAATPGNITRRSVAAYFYTSPKANKQDPDEAVSIFMDIRKADKAKKLIRMMSPPVIWKTIRRLKRR